MADFPKLKTGAVMQYPARKSQSYATRVVRFLDGQEQRYRESSGAIRRWLVALSMLDEAEVAALEAFFAAEQGAAGSFTFYDPWDETEYQNCSLEGDEFSVALQESGRSSLALTIRQNRS